MKQTYKKRVIAIITLVFSMITILNFPICTMVASAANPTVQPQWTSIGSMDMSFAFKGDDSDITATANKQSTASSIEGTLYLYKKVGEDWVYMDEAYGSKSRGTLALNIDFEAVSGVTYKAEFTVTAYTNGVGETTTIERIKTCP